MAQSEGMSLQEKFFMLFGPLGITGVAAGWALIAPNIPMFAVDHGPFADAEGRVFWTTASNTATAARVGIWGLRISAIWLAVAGLFSFARLADLFDRLRAVLVVYALLLGALAYAPWLLAVPDSRSGDRVCVLSPDGLWASNDGLLQGKRLVLQARWADVSEVTFLTSSSMAMKNHGGTSNHNHMLIVTLKSGQELRCPMVEFGGSFKLNPKQGEPEADAADVRTCKNWAEFVKQHAAHVSLAKVGNLEQLYANTTTHQTRTELVYSPPAPSDKR